MSAVRWHEGGAGLFAGLPEGFAAGFTTRRDAPDATGDREHAHRLADALGAPGAEVARVRQVHGRAVIVASGPQTIGRIAILGEADAVAGREPGRVLAVSTADCVPLVLVEPRSGWHAAVHAGWRGTAARILDSVLDLLEREGADLDALEVFVGPSIGRDAYEVGPEVVDALDRGLAGIRVPEASRLPGRGDRVLLDVAAHNVAALRARGVAKERIHESRLCTATRPDLFPSYRRDGKGTGRILTGVVRWRS